MTGLSAVPTRESRACKDENGDHKIPGDILPPGWNLFLTELRKAQFIPEQKAQIDIAEGAQSFNADRVDIDRGP